MIRLRLLNRLLKALRLHRLYQIIYCVNPTGARNTAFIIIGISSLVYSLSELINWFKFARRRPKTPVTPHDEDIEDAKIIE